MNFRNLVALAALAISTSTLAHDYKAGDLRIDHPVARATRPGQPSGAAYFTIENKGKLADRLIAVESAIAKSAQIHSMTMDGNLMKMREVDGLDIKPESKVDLLPGREYHIMLVGLKQALKPGDKFPLTLTFEKAGKVNVSVWVNEDGSLSGKGTKPANEHKHD